jgi:putative redox protein
VVDIDIQYEGQLHCTARHAPSATTLSTDAPRDNQGKGESFSPTDLVATALGTCMVTTMGIAAKKHGWNIDGIEVHVQKHMTKQPPRRIERLPVRFSVPPAVASALSAEHKAELRRVAETCPVALSLGPNVEISLDFDW